MRPSHVLLVALFLSGQAEAVSLRRGTNEERAQRSAARAAARKTKSDAKLARKVENLGPVLRQAPRSVPAQATRRTPEATEADLPRAELLKQRFRGRAELASMVVSGRAHLREDAGELVDVLGKIEDELGEHPVFAADKVGVRDQRVLRRSADVRRDARLLMRRLAKIPGIVPGGYSPAVIAAATREFEQLLHHQDAYTRPDIEGVTDLLRDDVFAERLASHTAGRVMPNLEEGTSDHTAQLLPLADAFVKGADLMKLEVIDPKRPGGLPLELKVAAARDPDVAAALARLTAKGGVRLQRLVGTPHGVLEAINLIAVTSQENYLRTWLPALITKGQRPNLRPTTRGLMRARHGDLIHAAEDPTERLEAASDLVEAAVGEYLKVVDAEGRESDPDLAIVNRALDGSRRKLARQRMVFDNAHERTEGAQEIIKKMMYIGPIAHGLEMLDLGSIAMLATGMTDDVGAEIGEWRALRGSGFTNKELFHRAKILIPVGIGAGVAAYEAHHLLESGHNLLGGATFGASAVALSLTTAIQSIHMYRQGYEELLREGKVQGKLGPAMTKAFRKQLRQLERQLGNLVKEEHRPALLKTVRTQLEAEVASGAMTTAEVDGVLAELEKMDLEDVLSRVTLPSSRSQWKAAVAQDFSNPARLGLVAGAAVAPLMGMAAGAAGVLGNGFALAAVGSTESIVAGATVFAARKIDDFKYARDLKAELAAAQAKR